MRFRPLVIATIILLLSLSAGSALYRRQQRLSELPGECVAAFHKKNWPKLESLAQEWSGIDSASGSKYWLGIALKEQRKFEPAYHAFESIPLDGPRGIDAATERMEIQFHVFEKPLEAIQLAAKLLELDRKLASPRRHLIYFHAMMRNRVQLFQNVQLAIEDHVDLPEHYLYMMTMEDLGFRDADDVTRRWLDATPDSDLLKHANLALQIRTARAARMSSAPTL